MQRICVLLLVLGIFGQAFIRTAWTLHYQWNRAVYLEHCENRYKPELSCNGKCYLEKQITGSDDKRAKEPRLPENFRQFKDIQLYFNFPADFPACDHPADVAETSLPLFIQRRVADVSPAGIFKPPAA